MTFAGWSAALLLGGAPPRSAGPLSLSHRTNTNSAIRARQSIMQSSVALDIEPLQIVPEQLDALRSGSDQDFTHFFQFVDPRGELARSHASSAPDGPVVMFRAKVRREPRWKSIGLRPHAALLKHKSSEIIRSRNKGYVDDDTFCARVRVLPFFPDAPSAESEVLFQWILRRQLTGSLGAPKLVWRVDDISADFGGWVVKKEVGDNAAPIPIAEAAAKAAWLARFDP